MCDCVEIINKELAKNGQELPGVFQLVGNNLVHRLSIPIYRRDTGKPESRRKLPQNMVVKHCPFCGVPVDANPAESPR